MRQAWSILQQINTGYWLFVAESDERRTYTGTLRGSGNEMIGDSAKAPNLPANAFI